MHEAHAAWLRLTKLREELGMFRNQGHRQKPSKQVHAKEVELSAQLVKEAKGARQKSKAKQTNRSAGLDGLEDMLRKGALNVAPKWKEGDTPLVEDLYFDKQKSEGGGNYPAARVRLRMELEQEHAGIQSNPGAKNGAEYDSWMVVRSHERQDVERGADYGYSTNATGTRAGKERRESTGSAMSTLQNEDLQYDRAAVSTPSNYYSYKLYTKDRILTTRLTGQAADELYAICRGFTLGGKNGGMGAVEALSDYVTAEYNEQRKQLRRRPTKTELPVINVVASCNFCPTR